MAKGCDFFVTTIVDWTYDDPSGATYAALVLLAFLAR